MPAQLIGYDLSRPGQEYEELFDAIKNVGRSWWRCLDSTWIVITRSTPAEVANALKPYLDQNDSLAVFTLTGGAAWVGLSDKCSQWLRNNL